MNDKEKVRKIARRVITKNGLKPPIDIINLAKKYSEYEECMLPFDVEGLCVQSIDNKPKILINQWQVENRKRFTVAHELGHVILPWHAGSIACAPTSTDAYSNILIDKMEKEANLFAAEVLMPNEWIQEKFLKYSDDISGILLEVYLEAKVSIHAAVLRLRDYVGLGYHFLIAYNDEVNMLVRTDGTSYKGILKSIKDFKYAFSDEINIIELGEYQVFWAKEKFYIEKLNVSVNQDSNSLMIQILEDVYGSEDVNKFRNKINGIFGAANGRVKGSSNPKEDLHYLIARSLSTKRDLVDFENHSLFSTFVNVKIIEMLGKKK